ncbi:nuclear transport factor 2 family protein [Diaminobutyricibacter tongyongensis]|uniref:Nuclear transport factor 2 family protein n=1 Tax=Leifsonia tongyongensis TaxID=1268043 RepID=A0A6L9XXI0_9MICO|nr:nuclear transport factor 2 family protein [Diaminobutyricibacter tongyongensis]NEN06006.1 nuclear transport factor 2 family protein [Diaminobutyricibacter tongyongensis]
MRIHVPEGVPAVVSEAIEAANAHDTERFLDAFAATGTVDDWGRVFTGRDEIRGWSDREFIGLQVTLDDLVFVEIPDGVAVRARVGGGGFNGPSTFTFLVSGDSIDRMSITA